MAIEPYKGKFRTCLLEDASTAIVFTQPYTWHPSNHAIGCKFPWIELHLIEDMEWVDTETEEKKLPNRRDLHDIFNMLADAHSELCAQAFIHYWGRHEKPIE